MSADQKTNVLESLRDASILSCHNTVTTVIVIHINIEFSHMNLDVNM
jgi:hypothetical protein